MSDEVKTCAGCKYLRSKSDGAGGGMYFCYVNRPKEDWQQPPTGVVVGEWGHWTDDSDEPKGCAKYER